MFAFVFGVMPIATAQFVSLTDAGSSVSIVRDGEFAGTVSSWFLGSNVNHIAQQSYHYRLAGGDFERYVGSIGAATVTQFSANFVQFSWSHNLFDLSIRYVLTGGTNQSDLAEIVRIVNRSPNTRLGFSLFEYDDFDLNGTSDGDTATKLNSSTIRQTKGPVGVTVGATPIPSIMEVAGFPTILNDLTDLNVDNLDPTLTTFGPGDATFGMQWNVGIDGGQTFLMSKNKILVVPEPATMAALAIGLGAVLARRRRKA